MGRIICCGLGSGDPDLMTVRADRLIRGARRIAYFRKKGRAGQARRIVDGMLAPGCDEIAMEYPITTEIPFDSPDYVETLARFYDDWTERLIARASEGDVVVLCEGDPFFYGSFMHLHTRLRDRIAVEVVPGVPGMVGCWNAANLPMTWGDDALIVLMGTMDEGAMAARMADADALVVMKIGRNLPKIRRALARAGKIEHAVLVERGTMAGERIERLAERPEDAPAPYFAIVLAPGRGRRPALPA